MHRSSRFLFILGTALVVAGLIATVAPGRHVRRFDSKVTLSPNNPFHGRVISPKHACEIRRHVKVFNRQPGPDGLFGTTVSKRRGKWSLPATPNGNFYAKIGRRREHTAGKTFICRPDTSPTRHFGT